MDVYFDDLRVTHGLSDIVAGADYYPFGLKMDGREITRESFRFGYQGQFAEEDKETGWNSFELRMYDPVIGRWIRTDPAGQYWSSYMSMGNNPVNQIDPDGAYSKFGALWRSGFGLRGSIYQSGVDNGKEVWGFNSGGKSYFGDDARSQLNDIKELATADVTTNDWNKIMFVSNGHMFPGQQIGEPPGPNDVVNVIQDFGMGLPGNAQKMPRHSYNQAKNMNSFVERFLKLWDQWRGDNNKPQLQFRMRGDTAILLNGPYKNSFIINRIGGDDFIEVNGSDTLDATTPLNYPDPFKIKVL